MVADLDAFPLPTAPVVPHVECVQDRITHRDHARLPVALPLLPEHDDQAAGAHFARSKRSSRAAMEAYRNTGYNEISLLGLSTGDYPHIEELLRPLARDVSGRWA